MKDMPAADRLAALEATVTALQARLNAEQMKRRRRPAPAFRRASGAVVALVLLVILVPASLLAASPFTDLTGGVHDANIEAIYNAGITTGCDPGVAFCPEGAVTRQEMASFIARAAGLGANPPVANAQTLQGYAPNALLRVGRGKSTSGVALSQVTAGVVAVTMTTPKAGFILANGAMIILNPDGCPCYISMWLGRTANEVTGGGSVDIPANGGFENLAATWVFPVEAGTHTITLYANRATGGAAIGSGNITALFIPFGPTGGDTLDLP